MASEAIVIFWFRRDLRLHDNHGLFQALKSSLKVLPIFIFDQNILGKLQNEKDARVQFIFNEVTRLGNEINKDGGGLHVVYDNPVNAFQSLLKKYTVKKVYCNHDYEPYAIQRDREIRELLTMNGAEFISCKDQVIFEKSEVVKDDGKPYTIFTPYYRKWKAKLDAEGIKPFASDSLTANLMKYKGSNPPALSAMGFKPSEINIPSSTVTSELIKHYDEQRDFPSVDGTSRLGVHLRFGTVSIREQVKKALRLNETWLKELCWREFYMMILWHFPHVVNSSFKPAYDHIKWRNNEVEFDKWKTGHTGYPIVDAGMRELVQTGFMHNRVRMITASFLTKHLLIDWRWGEAWFAENLLDFELASNNGGWQWSSGSGCDSAPYFRIFNPYEQTRKFDPELKYVRKWVPEFEDFSYPEPLVDHKEARERCLRVYSEALKE